ncbi:MAG TPA: hypothetical protein VE462_00330 [Propionibacteriaceae bacterium]|nr:hypothetical protein [Propionibacteriaceae bacterium]
MLIGELWAAAETETRGRSLVVEKQFCALGPAAEAFLVGAAAAGVSKLSISPPVLAADPNAGLKG